MYYLNFIWSLRFTMKNRIISINCRAPTYIRTTPPMISSRNPNKSSKMEQAYWLSLAISIVAANSHEQCPRMDMCGSDGVTYENLCTLTEAQVEKPGLKVVYSGACGKPDDEKLCAVCPERKRLCGNDGRTYNNSTI